MIQGAEVEEPVGEERRIRPVAVRLDPCSNLRKGALTGEAHDTCALQAYQLMYFGGTLDT